MRLYCAVQAKIEFLKEDLSHLFDDRGIDPSAYEEVVDFKCVPGIDLDTLMLISPHDDHTIFVT